MIKLKKVITIFMFIFSMFLIENSKVNAYYSNNENGIINYHLGIYESDSENYRKKFTKENYNLFLKKITGLDYMYDYINNVKKEDPYNFNKGYDYIKNESYKQYGKYYFAMLSAARRQYFFVTDYPEQIKITNYGYEFDNFEITALYDSNKPVYYIVTNENTGQFTSKCISSNNVMGTTGNHETNLIHFVEGTNWYSSGGFYSNIPEIKISDNIKFSLYDYEIESGTTMFYGNETGELSINPSKPIVNYKNSFISNEDYDKLGKVSIEFSENDENISKYNYAQFKLQYGSNDFKQENIPIFSHYKVFGKANANTNWEEVDPKSISYNDEQMNLQVIDTSYDYVEGSLADSTVTVQMDFMKSLNSLYEIWKIEFYFDNTQNGYFYVADTLKNSKWTDTSKFLENYIYYEFPNDKMYAFISSENENNSGKIYFPTNSIENEEVKINFKYFDRKSNTYDSPIPTKIYDNDDYYSYIDFKFNNKEKILSVNRNKGSHVVNTYGTDILNFYKSWFGLNKKIIPNEITYFYVPIGYKVYFSNGKDITQVITSEGYVDIDNSTTTDYFNSSNVSDSISDLLKNISLEKNNKLISLINELYNKFRQSQIGGYVYMIIITSIIILVIKAIKR